MSKDSFPPHVVGNLIAQSLDVSCELGNVTQAERSLLREAEIPVARYREEMLFLAGFAQNFGISTFISDPHVRDEVLRGYREAWSNLGRHSEAGRVLYQGFLERCAVYAKAVSNLDPNSLSSIALAFGGFLASENSKAQVLALTFADGIFDSHVEGAQYALNTAGLLPGALDSEPLF